MLFLQEESWFEMKEDFVYVDKVPLEERVRGTPPPAKKEECEVCNNTITS